MKKLLSKKSAVIAIVCALVVMTVAAIFVFMKDGGSGVIVVDSLGNEVATVNKKGNLFEIAAKDDAYSEYVEIAVNEAIELYVQESDSGSDDNFFKDIRKVKTHLVTDYLLKIKDVNYSEFLKSDTPFSCVVVSPKGEVLAVYGSYDGIGSGYAQKKTYAGSTIKPLSVYGLLIETGKATFSTVFKDEPVTTVKNDEGKYVSWPSNASGDYSRRYVTLSDALSSSLNTVAVKGLQELTVSESVSFLEENFGINLEYEKATMKKVGPDEILGNIALGYINDGVSPLAMAGYYQIFPNGGTYTASHTVAEIEKSDGKVYSAKPETGRVLSEETVSIMRQLLKGVVSRKGTAHEACIEDLELAGKSGTSDGYADNWFIGFTPDYVCSVWHGFNDANKNSASVLFSEIAQKLPLSEEEFSISDGVVRKLYCEKTGCIKGENCESTAPGCYNKNNIPERCSRCD